MSVADYRFSAEPRTIENREKYREPENIPPSNLMFDRRIVRGNTYAAMIVPDSSRQEIERRERLEKAYRARMLQKQREAEAEEKLNADREDQEDAIQKDAQDFVSQEKVFDYEELESKENQGNSTQSKFYIDYPPSPAFIPPEAGVNQETQIEHDELFDFELEVDPILDAIVGKTLEQARLEVLEEDEIKSLKKHRQRFLQERNAELIEIQRIESEHIRREEESGRRKLQAVTRREQMEFAHQKYVCRIIAKRFLHPVVNNSLQELEDLGPYEDPSKTSMHEDVLPWLLQQATSSVLERQRFEALIGNIEERSVQDIQSLHKRALDLQTRREEEAKETALKLQRDTEERRANRVEMRILREKERQRQELEDSVYAEIVSRGNAVNNNTQQVFSDIDDNTSDKVLGVPGGRVGELVNLLARIEEVQNAPLTQAQVNEIIEGYVTNCMKCEKFAINVDEDSFAALLERLQVPQTEFYTLPEENQQEILTYLLEPSNGERGNTLAHMRSNPEYYGFRGELFNMLYTALFGLVVAKNTEEDVENPVREKVLISGVREVEAPESRAAVVRIVQPPKQDDEDDEEAKDPDSQSKGKSSPREPEVEDKTVTLSHSATQFSVFLVHHASYPFIRKELAHWLRSLKSFENIDSNLLYQKMMEAAEQYLEKRIKDIAGALYVFEFPSS